MTNATTNVKTSGIYFKMEMVDGIGARNRFLNSCSHALSIHADASATIPQSDRER